MKTEAVRMHEIVQDHERRISDLEHRYDTLEHKITSVENGQIRVENTILNEGKENRAMLTKLIDHQFEIKKINVSSKWQLWTSVFSAGGVFYLLFELFVK
ncbi:hypothetical protein [Priestia endophytica]|uniref:hypothetical protein n=1 Tax=Priestia endophytica TaxID=135735 RepID=UPI00124C0058|nr:hypothetical protein [Priestia endophytica]KAB2491755.1 hypothetical protein F8155_18800 [Priestia endophytica]